MLLGLVDNDWLSILIYNSNEIIPFRRSQISQVTFGIMPLD